MVTTAVIAIGLGAADITFLDGLDTTEWSIVSQWRAPRIALGSETLYTHAIKGFMGEAGLMPPKGGRMDYSDDDVKAAVDYMVINSQ